MPGIDRNAFVGGLDRRGGIHLDQLGVRTQGDLAALGLTPEALRDAAGRDGVIRGRRELVRLNRLVVDASPAREEVPTRRARVLKVLETERELAARRRPRRGVLYVGMRPANSPERDALRASTPRAKGGVTSVDADHALPVLLDGVPYATATVSDLEELGRALVAADVPSKAANRFIALLRDEASWRRPLLARLGLSLWAVGSGSLPVNRLVLSGHSAGSAVIDDTGAYYLDFDSLAALARCFPAGAARIEHLAVAACNCGHRAHVSIFRRIFPRLRSFFGYHGSAPLAERGGAKHLARWARQTADGRGARLHRRGMRNVAVWTRARGYRGKALPAMKSLRRELAALREKSYAPIQRGERRADTLAYPLQRYYQVITDLLYHPRLPASERAALRAHQKEVLRLRHPELG